MLFQWQLLPACLPLRQYRGIHTAASQLRLQQLTPPVKMLEAQVSSARVLYTERQYTLVNQYVYFFCGFIIRPWREVCFLTTENIFISSYWLEANTSGAFIAQLDQSQRHATPTNTHCKNISSCQNRGGEKIKECLCESESPRTGANVVPVNYRLQFFKENSPVVSKLLLMSAREREGRRHYPQNFQSTYSFKCEQTLYHVPFYNYISVF